MTYYTWLTNQQPQNVTAQQVFEEQQAQQALAMQRAREEQQAQALQQTQAAQLAIATRLEHQQMQIDTLIIELTQAHALIEELRRLANE